MLKKKNRINNKISLYLSFSIAFFLLLSLGIWQLNKHKIKDYNKGLVALKINKDPKELISLDKKIDSLEIITVKGELLLDKSIYFEPRTHKGKIGYHLLVPLKVDNKYVLVNRGFTENKIKFNKNTKEKIDGLIISFPKSKFFELKNDIINNKWYTLDLKQISNFLNLKLEPLLIYEINNYSNNTINVKPNTISNINHLNYAITWFLMAITLAIILVIFVRKA